MNTITLVDRVRAALSGETLTREVRMFGGLSFMLDQRMVVAVDRDGNLLVRIDPKRNSELVALLGATQAEMGAGRSMGPGWVVVSDGALVTDEALAFWLGVAADHHARSGRAPRGNTRGGPSVALS